MTNVAGNSAGQENNAGAWTLVASGNTVAGAATGVGVLTETEGINFMLPPGTWGLAVQAVSSGQNYTNGN